MKKIISLFLFCIVTKFTIAQEAKGKNETDLTGDYTFTNGSNITISKVEIGLAFFNFETGRFGILFKDSSKTSTYFAGPGVLGKFPREFEIEFIKTGTKIKSLVYYDINKGLKKSAIKSIPFREEETNIVYDSINLKTTISYPNTKGPWPAIVLVHGGGRVHVQR